MEVSELQHVLKCSQRFPEMPLWIIEYTWAHRMMDVHEAVDPSSWPDMDSEHLSLQDSWKLRVTSAKVYSIVKNRNVPLFERVMDFLETTYRLLPSLVASIKHMKIMFGLKTMAIMWMFNERRGMVDTVFKINQFFTSKLPQYQDKCSHHEMFLMRKNHMNFKALAHGLAMDKDKLEDYIMNHMEEQYGERYAQKVEDRLLHYLHMLETTLPEETYIDKLLKKNGPATEEEELLLKVVTSDSTTIATILKNLLHCDVPPCDPGSISQVESALPEISSGSPDMFVEATTPPEFHSDVSRGGETGPDVSKESPLLLENDSDSDVRIHLQLKADGDVVRSVSVRGATSSPQFCSKHHRWVESILQQCPDECSEELLLQANVALSPPLLQSSSSTTSSQDLTPSNLIPCHPDQQGPTPQTSTHHQTAAQACETANPEEALSSGSLGLPIDTPQMEPKPSLSRNNMVPTYMSPVVRLVDITSVRGIHIIFNPHQTSPNQLISSNKEATPTCSLLQRITDYNQETVAPVNSLKTTELFQKAPVSSCPAATPQLSSRPSKRFRRACTTSRQLQALDGISENPLVKNVEVAFTKFQKGCQPLRDDFNVSRPATQDASTSSSQSGLPSSVCPTNQISSSTESPQHPQTCNNSPCQSKTRPSTVTPPTSHYNSIAPGFETSRVQRAQMRLSLPSQTTLLQSKLLQPFVSLSKLSTQDCHQVTNGRCSSDRRNDDEEEGDTDMSFDLNILYSSYSSSTDGEDSLRCDPDYTPAYSFKRKRFILEY